MKQTIETEIKIDWTKMYQIVFDAIKGTGFIPDKYEVFDDFEVNSYSYLCDYFDYPSMAEEDWFTDSDIDSAINEFEEYIDNVKD